MSIGRNFYALDEVAQEERIRKPISSLGLASKALDKTFKSAPVMLGIVAIAWIVGKTTQSLFRGAPELWSLFPADGVVGASTILALPLSTELTERVFPLIPGNNDVDSSEAKTIPTLMKTGLVSITILVITTAITPTLTGKLCSHRVSYLGSFFYGILGGAAGGLCTYGEEMLLNLQAQYKLTEELASSDDEALPSYFPPSEGNYKQMGKLLVQKLRNKESDQALTFFRSLEAPGRQFNALKHISSAYQKELFKGLSQEEMISLLQYATLDQRENP